MFLFREKGKITINKFDAFLPYPYNQNFSPNPFYLVNYNNWSHYLLSLSYFQIKVVGIEKIPKTLSGRLNLAYRLE